MLDLVSINKSQKAKLDDKFMNIVGIAISLDKYCVMGTSVMFVRMAFCVMFYYCSS